MLRVPDLKQKLVATQRNLGLSPDEIRQRLRLSLINEARIPALQDNLRQLDRVHLDCIHALFMHLEQFDEPSHQLRDQSQLPQLKQQQQRYFRRMLLGPYDMQYARLRLLAGLIHQRQG